jgi:hypothetical protein
MTFAYTVFPGSTVRTLVFYAIGQARLMNLAWGRSN